VSYARNIDIPLEAIADFCRRNAIRKLSVFGSALRDDFRSGSDVDLLRSTSRGGRHLPGYGRAGDRTE
jgi:predicted nucleotidyltransferase